MDPAQTIVKVTTTYGIAYDIETSSFTTTKESETVELLPRDSQAPATAATKRAKRPA